MSLQTGLREGFLLNTWFRLLDWRKNCGILNFSIEVGVSMQNAQFWCNYISSVTYTATLIQQLLRCLPLVSWIENMALNHEVLRCLVKLHRRGSLFRAPSLSTLEKPIPLNSFLPLPDLGCIMSDELVNISSWIKVVTFEFRFEGKGGRRHRGECVVEGEVMNLLIWSDHQKFAKIKLINLYRQPLKASPLPLTNLSKIPLCF